MDYCVSDDGVIADAMPDVSSAESGSDSVNSLSNTGYHY